MERAHKLATNLSGGDTPPEEQDEIIDVLEAMRDQKRAHLQRFASLIEHAKFNSITESNDSSMAE